MNIVKLQTELKEFANYTPLFSSIPENSYREQYYKYTIVWNEHSLHVPDDFEEKLKEFMSSDLEYTSIFVTFLNPTKVGHLTVLVINNKTKKAYKYDPAAELNLTKLNQNLRLLLKSFDLEYFYNIKGKQNLNCGNLCIDYISRVLAIPSDLHQS